MSKLNPKQQAFADEYIATGNVFQSAIKAGYSDSYARTHAYKLLDNARISEYIKNAQEQAKHEAIATVTERKLILTSIMQDEEKRDGDRLKAIEVLNKMDGLGSENITLKGTVQTNPLKDLSFEEIKEIAKERYRSDDDG